MEPVLRIELRASVYKTEALPLSDTGEYLNPHSQGLRHATLFFGILIIRIEMSHYSGNTENRGKPPIESVLCISNLYDANSTGHILTFQIAAFPRETSTGGRIRTYRTFLPVVNSHFRCQLRGYTGMDLSGLGLASP